MAQTRRVIALANGDKYYDTGKPCKRGHYSIRYACNYVCVQCSKGAHLRWSEEQLSKRRDYHRRWDRQNEAKMSETEKEKRRIGARVRRHNLSEAQAGKWIKEKNQARRQREKARAKGDTYYDTGVPCRNGHYSKKFVSSTECVQCGKERFLRQIGTKDGQIEQTPRATALANGDKYYDTGKPCKHGHYSIRYAFNSVCVQCRKERRLSWSEVKKEKMRIKVKAKRDNLSEAETIKLIKEKQHARRQREHARANGHTYYDTGLPCRNGHYFMRYVSSTVCVQCRRENYLRKISTRNPSTFS